MSSGCFHNDIERILAEWLGELPVTLYRGREVTGFAKDHTGVDVELSLDGPTLACGASRRMRWRPQSDS